MNNLGIITVTATTLLIDLNELRQYTVEDKAGGETLIAVTA